MKVDKDELGSLGILTGSSDNPVINYALNHIASTDPDKILQNTELKFDDLYWVTALNILDMFVITPFCKNRAMIQHFRKFRDRTLLSLVSLKREGRKEIFDAMKPREMPYPMPFQVQEPKRLGGLL